VLTPPLAATPDRAVGERVAAGLRITVVAASGCDDITGTWLSSYRQPLIGFVLPLVNGDLQAAEDVVQETMIRGWQHSTQLRPEHAGSWLHTVARNIAISTYHRRRKARPPEIPLDERILPLDDDGHDRILDSLIVATALGLISDEHRTVISELYYQRRSVAEVAVLLGVPEGTVRSRCFYGLRALRRVLEGQGITRP
jgi:RNA polymerase sigma-70 factor (ECF subfamily)